VDELRAAIAINPHNASWHFHLGQVFDELDQSAEAVEAYRRAAELAPEDRDAFQRLGVALTQCGRFHEALPALERVESLDPSFEPSYCQRIVVYTELDDHDKAEEMFYLARQCREECPHCFYNIGCSLAVRRQLDKALYCWQKALDLDERYPQAHLRIAEALWEKQEHEQARRHYLAELRRNPGEVATLLDLGSLLMDMGRTEEAGEKFRRAIEHDPDSAAARFCHGRWLLASDRTREAEVSLRRALTLDPTFGGAHCYLAQALLQRGRIDEAREHLRAELRCHPEQPALLLDLANLLIDCGDIRPAAACLKRLLKAEPRNAAAWQVLGVACFMRGRHREGIDATLRSFDCDPGQATAAHNLALAYEQTGDYAEALAWVRKAKERDPAEPSLQRLELRIRARRVWTRFSRALRRVCLWR
jgi:protein O-GlcNAc transferase